MLLVPGSAQLKKEKKDKNTHPGKVVDAYAGTGILARAYAYGSQKIESREDCPVYQDPLDAQSSDQRTGAFAFSISKDKGGYLTVYCQPGYVSRTETTNANSEDGTNVQPRPVKLFPLKSKLPPQMRPTDAAVIVIARDLDEMTANFKYYAKASSEGYSAAMKEKFRENGDLVEAIKNRKPYLPEKLTLSSPTFADIGNSQAAFVAIATDLDNARSNFIYYESADREAFGHASLKFPGTDQAIINRLSKRSAPFLAPAVMEDRPVAFLNPWRVVRNARLADCRSAGSQLSEMTSQMPLRLIGTNFAKSECGLVRLTNKSERSRPLPCRPAVSRPESD